MPIFLFISARTGTTHVVTTVRKYKDRVYRTHLLRCSYREGCCVVTTGTWCGILHAQRGDTVVATFDGIGEARVAFAAQGHTRHAGVAVSR